ncbi:MAG: acyltransferase family protein [Solirubrobacterales bacterium]
MLSTSGNQIGRQRDAGLDGLRGLAAVAVLLFHVWLFTESHTTTRREGLLDYVLVEFKLGLYLFFVLSGFLLVRPFLRAAMNGEQTPRFVAYTRNRVARIAPAYWLSLVGAAALLLTAGGSALRHMPAGADVWQYVFFGQNFSEDTIMRLNPATWSLPIELAFYLLVPGIGLLAVVAARRLRESIGVSVATGVVALLMIIAGLYWNKATVGESSVYRLALPGMLPYFALGMLAALGAGLWERRGKATGVVLHLPTAVFVCGLLVLAAAIYNYERNIYSETLQVIRDVPAATGFALIVAGVAMATDRSRFGRALSWRPLVALGTVSYGVYLWHVPLLLAGRTAGWLPDGMLAASALVLTISLALGALSWRFVESPSIAWARKDRAPERDELAAHRERRPMHRPATQPALAGTTTSSSSANLPVARSVSASG